MIRLSKPQILLLHEQLLEATGGSSGLRDEGMLDSALNGIELEYTQKELSNIILQLAEGTISSSELLGWILTLQV